MKKNLFFIAAISVFIFSACKKENDAKTRAKAPQQLEQLLAKYPNLKVISTSGTNNYVLTGNELKALDDSLAVFSSLAKDIKVVPNTLSTSIKKISTESLKTSSTLATNDDDTVTGYGSYAWSSSQRVGSSELGYYTVSYFASFQYYSKMSRVNIISGVSSLKSSAPSGVYAGTGGTLYYYSYNFDYTPISNIFSLTNNSQTANLGYSGQVSLVKTLHVIGGSTSTVASQSAPLTLNTAVWSSTFPWIYPN